MGSGGRTLFVVEVVLLVVSLELGAEAEGGPGRAALYPDPNLMPVPNQPHPAGPT